MTSETLIDRLAAEVLRFDNRFWVPLRHVATLATGSFAAIFLVEEAVRQEAVLITPGGPGGRGAVLVDAIFLCAALQVAEVDFPGTVVPGGWRELAAAIEAVGTAAREAVEPLPNPPDDAAEDGDGRLFH